MGTVRRNEVIDGYRGIAIITVMAYHFCYAWQQELGLNPGASWLKLGALGVQIFFVISGLVIAMTLLRSENAMNFIIRRFARLMPAYWASCCLIFVGLLWFDPLSFSPTMSDFLSSLVLSSIELNRSYVDGAFWSLNVEIKFYAITALSYAAMRDKFWIGIIFFAIVGMVFGLYSASGKRLIFIAPYMPFFLTGLALWFGAYAKNLVATLSCAGTAVLGYISHIPFYTQPDLPAWLPHLYLAATLIILIYLILMMPEIKTGPLAWIGRCSYSIYLIHQRLGVSLIAALIGFGLSSKASVLLAFMAAIMAGWALYRFVELPGQRFVLHLFSFRLRQPQPHTLNEDVNMTAELGRGASQ